MVVGLQLQVLPQEENNKTTGTNLANPQAQINGRTIAWFGELSPGQYLTLWPGEKPIVRGPDARLSLAPAADQPTSIGVDRIELPVGSYTARFTSARPSAAPGTTAPFRVRLFFLAPERHPIPK
jgi:hypothetical protein